MWYYEFMERTYRTHPCADCGEPCAHNAMRCQRCAGRERFLRPTVKAAVTAARLRSQKWRDSISGPRKPFVVSRGYAYVRRPEHPAAGKRGYVRRTLLIAEGMLGRALVSDEIVHHRDGDTLHDAPENLEVMTRGDHRRLHGSAWHRRLSPEQVRKMRQRHATGEPMASLGRAFGISRPAVRAIVDRRHYRDVE